MTEKIRAVTDLNTLEVTLCRDGKNRKRFAFFKSEDNGMSDTDQEFGEILKSIVEETELDEKTESRLEAFCKQEGVDEKGKAAAKAMLKIGDGFKDNKKMGKILKALSDMAGYPTPKPAAKQEPEKEKEKEKPVETQKQGDEKDKGFPPPNFKGKKQKPEEEKEEMQKALDHYVGQAPAEMQPIIKSLWQNNQSLAQQLQSANEKTSRAEHIAKAREEYPNLPIEAEKIGDLLLKSEEADLGGTLAEILKSANEIAGQNKALFMQMGGIGGLSEAGSATARLEKAAEALIQKSEGGLTMEQAFAKLADTPEGRTLYNEHLAEMRGGQ